MKIWMNKIVASTAVGLLVVMALWILLYGMFLKKSEETETHHPEGHPQSAANRPGARSQSAEAQMLARQEEEFWRLVELDSKKRVRLPEKFYTEPAEVAARKAKFAEYVKQKARALNLGDLSERAAANEIHDRYMQVAYGISLEEKPLLQLGWSPDQIQKVQNVLNEAYKELETMETRHRVVLEQSDARIVFDVVPFDKEMQNSREFMWEKISNIVGEPEAWLLNAFNMDIGRKMRGYGEVHWRYDVTFSQDGMCIKYGKIDKNAKYEDVGTNRTILSNHEFQHLITFSDKK